jgi:hypothetical protein
MDKYAELYQLTKESLAQAEDRFNAIDGKASSYLSLLTLLVATAGFFVKWVVDRFVPPAGILELAMVLLALATTGTVVMSWYRAFQVLRVHRTRGIVLSDETIQFFDKNRLIDIHYALAKENTVTWRANRSVNDAKAAALASAYRWTTATVALLLVFSSLYLALRWIA